LLTTNGELEFSVIKNVFAIVIFGMTTSLSAESVFFSSFQIEIQDTWEHSFESASFYRQWWLVSERTILFVVYQCDPESRDIETEEIDMIVRSITAGNA